MLTELFLLGVALIILWYWKTRLPSDHPPTPPIRLPILGHFHYLLMYPATKTTTGLYELYKAYSKNGVLSFHVGTQKITLIGTYQLARELFTKEETNRRVFDHDMAEKFKKPRQNLTGTEGIVFNHGDNWREQRRFMLSTLRDFGFGKSGMEEMINDEINYFSEIIESRLSDVNSRQVENVFNIPILNILWQIVAGQRYDYNDPKLKDLVYKSFQATNTPFSKPGIVDIKKFLVDEINSHRETFDPENIRDFIDSYLLEIKENGVEGSSFHESQGYEQLANVLIDLFIAGTETTSNTLTFAFLYMIRETKIQEKCRQEIFDVVGRNRQPSLQDRVNLPFVDATIMEIQRIGDIAPEGVFHMTTTPMKAGPYVIPRGHMLMSSLTAIMKSPDHWKNTDKFDPERFIGPTGRIAKDEKLIPFSTGKRQCPGESLAKAEIFLFFTGLLQKFKFEPEDPNNPPEVEMVSGVTSAPKPFMIKISRIL